MRARWVPSRLISVASSPQSASSSRGLDGRQGADGVVQELGAVRAGDPGQDHAVAGEHLDPVARMSRQGGEQEGCVHGRVEPRRIVHATGRGSRGVDDDDDPAVLLGLPGADHEVLAAGGGAPVDAAHVVSVDVVAQAVELGALSPGAQRCPTVQLPQHGEPAGQVLAGGERVQRPQPPRYLERPLPGGQAERSGGADRHPVARCGRHGGSGSAWSSPGCAPRPRRPGYAASLRPRPRVATHPGWHRAAGASSGVGDQDRGRGLLAETDLSRALADEGQRAGRARQEDVEADERRGSTTSHHRTVLPWGHRATGTSPNRVSATAR